MEQIKKAWRGQEKLWKVFWIYGVVVGIILRVAGKQFDKLDIMPLTLSFGFIMLVYAIWSLVAVWRCAFNARIKFWGYIVRVLVIVNVVLFVLGIIMGAFGVGKSTNGHGAAPVEAQANEISALTECNAVMEKQAAVSGITAQAYAHTDEHFNKCMESKGGKGRLHTLPKGSEHYVASCKKDYVKQNQGKDPDAFFALRPALLKECVTYKIAFDKKQDNVRINLPAEIAKDSAAPQCMKMLREHAQKNNQDVQIYVSQNSQWIIDCVQASQKSSKAKQ